MRLRQAGHSQGLAQGVGGPAGVRREWCKLGVGVTRSVQSSLRRNGHGGGGGDQTDRGGDRGAEAEGGGGEARRREEERRSKIG